MHRHLPEPDDVGPEPAGRVAARAGRRGRKILLPGHHRRAAEAAGAAQRAMHLQQPQRSCAGMQVIDILGDDQHLGRPAPLQLRQRQMRGIRHDGRVAELGTARVVEAMHARGVACEGLRRRDILDPHLRPDPVRVAEGGEPGFPADAGPGQHDDRIDEAGHAARLAAVSRGLNARAAARGHPRLPLSAPPAPRPPARSGASGERGRPAPAAGSARSA